MANDTVAVVAKEIDPEEIIKYGIYLVAAVILVVGNGLILGALLRHAVLRRRKEYIILSGLAAADMVAGLATFVSAIYRTYLILNRQDSVLISRWECARVLHFILFITAQPLQAVMLFLISVDRVIALGVPRAYFAFGTSYGKRMVAAAYAVGLSFTLYGIFSLYSHHEPVVKRTCVTSATIDSTFNAVLGYYRTGLSTASVLLYVVVFALYRHGNKVAPTGETSVSAFKRRQQKRLTITLSISCFFTLVFYVIPVILTGYLRSAGVNMSSISPYLWLIICTNAALNIFVYTGRHADIRAGVKYLLRCKELPPNYQETAAAAQRKADARQDVQWNKPRPRTAAADPDPDV